MGNTTSHKSPRDLGIPMDWAMMTWGAVASQTVDYHGSIGNGEIIGDAWDGFYQHGGSINPMGFSYHRFKYFPRKRHKPMNPVVFFSHGFKYSQK